MSQPVSNQSEPSKMKKLLIGEDEDASPLDRIRRSAGGKVPQKSEGASTPKVNIPIQPQAASKPTTKSSPKTIVNKKEYKFLPAFWTIASVVSMLVNIGVVIALVVIVQWLGGTEASLAFAKGQATGLLGGLHENFVKMDEASITTTIHVEKDIPVQFSLNVSGNTIVTLSENVPISGARVTLLNGDLIKNESAYIVLPAGTKLPVFIENLVVPVDKTVPVVLDVPVDIPLNTTELHDPFVGLRKVVEPYYCLLQKNVIVNGVDVCANAAPILPVIP